MMPTGCARRRASGTGSVTETVLLTWAYEASGTSGGAVSVWRAATGDQRFERAAGELC